VPLPEDQSKPEVTAVLQIVRPSIQTGALPAEAADTNRPVQIEEAPVPPATITAEVVAEALHLTNHGTAPAAPDLLPDVVPVEAALHRVPDQVLAAPVAVAPDPLLGNR